MGALLTYILKSGLCLILFYMLYKSLLSRETFHRFNRVALISLLLVSSILPFIELKKKLIPMAGTVYIDFSEVYLMAEPVTEASIPFQWTHFILLLYLTGFILFTGKTIASFIRLYLIIRKEPVIKGEQGEKLILTNKQIAPFSWMNYIVISTADWQESGKEILCHEKGHIHYGHSWDLLLIQCSVILHWFNPAAWLLKRELQNVHEYEADEWVLDNGIDARMYQLLLIKKAVGEQRFTSLTNNFNHSKLKNRISMMIKDKSNPATRFRLLTVLPLSLLAVTLFAREEIQTNLEKLTETPLQQFIQEKVVSPPKQEPETMAAEEPVEPDTPLIVVDGEEITDIGEVKPEEIKSISVLKDSSAVQVYGNRGIPGVVLVSTIREDTIRKIKTTLNNMEGNIFRRGIINQPAFKVAEPAYTIGLKQQEPFSKFVFRKPTSMDLNPPHVVIDGVDYTYEEFESLNLDAQRVESISVLKDDYSTGKYGEKAKNGVIIITTKK